MLTKRAAFFDIDKTLVRVNSSHLYMRWRMSRGEAGIRDVLRTSGWLLRYAFGTLNMEEVTKRALRDIRDLEEERFASDCETWFSEVVRAHVTEQAIAEVAARRAQGFVCVILSAVTPYAAEPLARLLGIEHILCTRLVVANGRFTGQIHEPLCYGSGKVTLAEAWATKEGVDLHGSAFYSDSLSDLPMLERVGDARVINPDLRLSRLAKKRGWPIEQWR